MVNRSAVVNTEVKRRWWKVVAGFEKVVSDGCLWRFRGLSLLDLDRGLQGS